MPVPVRVVVVSPGDPEGDQVGGIATFIAGMVRNAPADFEFDWVGVTRSQRMPLGRWEQVSVADRGVSFLPVARAPAQTGRRPRIPVAASFAVGLWRYRDEFSRRGVLQFHRPGTALPLLGSGAPKVQVLHYFSEAALTRSDAESRWRHIPRLLPAMHRIALPRMDQVFAVNEQLSGELHNRYPSLRGRVHFIPNWYDDRLFRPAEPGTADDSLLLMVGRLELVKDPFLGLAAFRQFIADGGIGRLVIVGDGSQRAALEAELGPADSDLVSVIGHLRQEGVATMMRNARALVIPSRAEAGPTVALEALASGVPVIAPAIGRIPQLVAHQVNGFIASDRTPSALAEGIRWAVASDAAATRIRCVESVRDYRPVAVLREFYETMRILASTHIGV